MERFSTAKGILFPRVCALVRQLALPLFFAVRHCSACRYFLVMAIGNGFSMFVPSSELTLLEGSWISKGLHKCRRKEGLHRVVSNDSPMVLVISGRFICYAN